MNAINYDKLARSMMKRRSQPYPEYKHNYTSRKYKSYVYNISIDGVIFWHGRLDLFGITWRNDFYSNNEEVAARWVYQTIKKHLNKVKRQSKRRDNKTFDKHIKWQMWLLNYQHHQYPIKICELKVY